MTRMRALLVIGLLLFPVLARAAEPCDGFRIGRYVSSARSWSTNSWWIEGPSGVVLVDTQLLTSAVRELVEVAEGYTGKKVELAFVLNASADRFNGTGFLAERGVRVMSSEQVVNAIPAADRRAREALADRYAPDYPERLVLPRIFGTETLNVTGGGLEFKVLVLGAGIGRAQIAVQLGPHLFVGDILANRHHARLEGSNIEEWLATLDELRRLGASYVYPGRGYAAGPALFDKQAEYLKVFRNEIAARHPRGPLPANVKADIVAGILQRYPDYDNAEFVGQGVVALWRKYVK